MAVTNPNPNGANGTTSDPREQVMWDIYIEKLTKGIDNAKASAIEAGYSEPHADNITLQGWFKERKDKLRRKEMFSKAERNLNKGLDESYYDKEGNVRSDVMRIVMDVSKTVATTLGKDEGYSGRNELTGKGGKDLPTPLLNAILDNNINKEDNQPE
jgi:hypothetical protein